MHIHRRTRYGWSAALLALALTPLGGAAAAGLDGWQPPQVIDAQDRLGTPSALVATANGSTAIVYPVGRQTWASVRPGGSGSAWEPPQQLVGAPREATAGPVATGSGGGATVFLSSPFFEVAYAQLSPDGSWTRAKPFPYQSTFVPEMAMVRPGSGIVALGSTGYGKVRAAVKPQGGSWQLSPGLELGHAVVRGAWYDAQGRVHVVVGQHAHADRSHSRSIYTSVLRRGGGGLQWGELRRVPTGDGILASVRDITVVSNDAGAITLLWQEYDDNGRPRQHVRHRDPLSGWSTTRRLPRPANSSSPVVGTMSEDGTTRLAYVRTQPGPPNGDYQLVTRVLTADGTLGEEEVLDTFTRDGFGFEGVAGAGDDLLLRWWSSTDGALEHHVFRCLDDDCAAAGTFDANAESVATITPDGSAFLAGVGAGGPGCSSGELCSRRLPQSGGTP